MANGDNNNNHMECLRHSGWNRTTCCYLNSIIIFFCRTRVYSHVVRMSCHSRRKSLLSSTLYMRFVNIFFKGKTFIFGDNVMIIIIFIIINCVLLLMLEEHNDPRYSLNVYNNMLYSNSNIHHQSNM